jgi:hypothetical protein
MTVTVSRERYKDSPALPPLTYVAEVLDLERVDEEGDEVTSVVLRDCEAKKLPPNAQKLLDEVRKGDPNHVWSTEEIREVGRKQFGFAKASLHGAVEKLTASIYVDSVVTAAP